MLASSHFAHLHLHTQYSLLDGANKITTILSRAYKLGQTSIAMTDHGNLHGAMEFYLEARKVGIKPIIGCELYVTTGSRLDKRPRAQGGAGTHHITALAQNLEGYHNLCRLISLAYREGFYFKPRVDHELLQSYSKGIIILSGCLASELAKGALDDDEKRCKETVEFYSKTFPDRFFLEVQPHQIEEQKKLNHYCELFGQRLGIPLVATTDCHYPEKEDHFAQEVLMCISTGKTVHDSDRIQHKGVHLHLKGAQEMLKEFGDFKYGEEAIKTSAAIAERCNVEFEFNRHYMPNYESNDERPLAEQMAEKARIGLTKRLNILRLRSSHTQELERQYIERLEEEIRLIDEMGFAGYFLVVSDFIVWAKDHNIPVGPGRGSVAGSLVAYALRITEVDPIPNKLLFERFLNPERVSLPDIDVDFCINGRDAVISYVAEKYGKDKVAQIASFGTLKAKAAIKDVGRALGISYAEADRVAQLIPAPRQGFDYSLSDALKMEKRLQDYARGEGKQLIELALKLEGLTRHSSTHAAGVVIGDRPLMEMLPMMLDKDGNDVTQFSKDYVEKIGLVKFDFLGLRTLTVIHAALNFVKKSRGETIILELLPLDDQETFKMLCSGNTTGVFQLESGGITEMTMRLRPSCFDDLVAILALYRPGPLDAGMVEHYIKRKHGKEKVEVLHPLMGGILSDTYGIILYQEQIMQLARELAGYSLGEADLLRKAMGKKNPEEMAKQRERFIQGGRERDIKEKLANQIFDQMETFARYGFNRSHSAAYALISFQTAYLKAHYNVEFMAALMSEEMGDSEKTFKNRNECRKQNVELLPPDVNESEAKFSVKGGKIRYGLEALKGVGSKAVCAILEARERGGGYSDLSDFIDRVDLKAVNRRVMEALIKCGGFDYSGISRREMLESLEDLLKAGQSAQKDRDSSQMSLFADDSVMFAAASKKLSGSLPEWPVNMKLAFEREALGFYISGHPLEKFRPDLKRLGARSTSEIRRLAGHSSVSIAGVITSLKLKNTKKGDRYATFSLEDWQGTLESIVWPSVYLQFSQFLVSDDPIMVWGRPDVTEERAVLIVEKLESLINLRDRNAKQGLLLLGEEDSLEDNLEGLRRVLEKHPGNCPVKIRLKLEGKEVSINLSRSDSTPMSVLPSENLCDEIEQLFGRPVLSFQ